MARFITGTCGLANIDNDDSIRAEDVSYDNSGGLYPPGTDNVQDALDNAGGGPSVASMTPTVEGVAFGSQDPAKELNSLGAGVSVDASTNRATARYLALSPGAPQAALYSGCIFDSNRCDETGATTCSDSTWTANGSSLNDSQCVNSAADCNLCNVSATSIGDSVLEVNKGSIKSAALLNSSVLANDSTLDNSTFDQATLHVCSLTAPGIGFEGATALGSMRPTNVTQMRESMFLASNAGAAVDQKGRQSLYVGNQSLNETVNDREAWFSAYDRFFLRTLRADSAPPDVCYYDPGTAELTYGPAPSVGLPAKQPNTLGGQYGINSLANASDVNGRGSFVNYAAGPAQLAGVSAVGNQLYAASTPGTNSFTDLIALGRNHAFVGAQSITNSFIAANGFGVPGISQVSGSVLVTPRASGVGLGFAGAITSLTAVTGGQLTLTADPLGSAVFASGGTVNPGTGNLVLSAQPSTGSLVATGSGNIHLQAAGTPTAISPTFSNCATINSGTTTVVPTANLQLCSNHTSLRMPLINAVGVADINTTPLGFNSTTGLIAPTLSSLFSRVYRAVGTTTLGGQVVFTPGGSINPSTVGYSMSATVRNTSTTVAYTCSINAVSATSITVQVFNSVTVVLAAQSMVPSGAGIIVHFSMCY